MAEELSIEQLNDPNINQFLSALYGGPIFDGIYGTGTSSPANIGNTLFGTYYSCAGAPGSTPQPASAPMPNCDIYYNRNKSYDHQFAGFGELTYKLTDQLSLTAGGRYAKLSFSLDHYANGYEDYGPSQAGGTEHESAFTPKLGLNYQADEHNLFYATYAKGFRPGGYNPPLPPLFCAPGLVQDGFPSGQSPQTYNSDTTQSYEIGSKNNFNDRLKIASSVYYIQWNGIQQNVYVAGNCGLQFTDNLGTAVAKGFDFQANAALGGGVSLEASVGYTDAKFSKTSLNNLAVAGDAISGEASINYSPGTNAPWTIAVGPQVDFRAADHDAFVRLDWEYTSQNNWLAPVQDPRSLQYDPFSYPLPATSFFSLRGGVKLGGWQVSMFVDNLFDSHTVLNYALVQNDSFNPAGPVRPQENDFAFRPRTIGITATFKQ
jgi:outer membrane receptor protein involved in Fe transport